MAAVHPRQVIREAVATALRFKTAAQDRVYARRRVVWTMRELPGLSVGTPDEESEATDLDGTLDRTVQVVVSAVVATDADEDVDAVLDARAAEIEAAMSADPTFGGVLLSCTLKTTHEEEDPAGRLMAAKVLTFEARYQTDAPA